MLVHTSTKKIVLNLRDPDRVTTVIPTAKKFMYKGHELVAVPHKIEETKMLRNLGFNAPGPIKHYYEWSGEYAPFAAQRETSEFLTLHSRAFCLNDMGTGKTLATLWAYDYLRSLGALHKALIISPLSTLDRTWGDEIFRHFPHLNFTVLYGTKERRVKLLKSEADIYLINHDGIKVIEKEINENPDIDLIVIDEIASFRNAGTARWRSLKKIIASRSRVWGLTGTPTPNAPTDAWAQCRLISPERVPGYFGQWKNAVMRQLSQFKWVAKESATEQVHDAMQPAIRFSRDDCVDLPPCIWQERHVPMTAEQKTAYTAMLGKLAMEYQGDAVVAANEAVKMQKLLQIACGVVYGDDRQHVYLPAMPRIEVVREVVEEAGTKVIVFVPFKGVLSYVATKLAEDFTVESISGDTPKHERDRIFHAFQQLAEPRVLVAQPAAMSHGLTLTAASTVVWFAPVTSNEIYEQANARVTRPGQKHTQFVVNVEGSDVERRLYARLRDKQKLQGLLLDMVRGVS
jgi:SNF2 family DNA or RNA helicase